MTVTSFFADPTDGWVRSRDPVWAICRAGGGMTMEAAPDHQMVVGGFIGGGPHFAQMQSFCSFDTSSLSGQTVSAVLMELCCDDDSSDVVDYDIEVRPWNFGAAVTIDDWVPGATLAGLTLCGTLTTLGISTVAYNSVVENGANFANSINTTGTTHYSLASSRLSGDIEVAGQEIVDIAGTDSAGTTRDPKITVTHSVTVAGTGDATGLVSA